MTNPATSVSPPPARSADRRVAVALLRITLGVILVVAWFDNLDKSLYTADGFEGFVDFLFRSAEDGGNGSSLGFYETILRDVVVPLAPVYVIVQLVVELALGIALVLGVFTRAASLVAAFFFFNLFLSYFGGEEWIWTYVLLTVAAVAVFLGWAGRAYGLDERIAAARGESPRGLLW